MRFALVPKSPLPTLDAERTSSIAPEEADLQEDKGVEANSACTADGTPPWPSSDTVEPKMVCTADSKGKGACLAVVGHGAHDEHGVLQRRLHLSAPQTYPHKCKDGRTGVDVKPVTHQVIPVARTSFQMNNQMEGGTGNDVSRVHTRARAQTPFAGLSLVGRVVCCTIREAGHKRTRRSSECSSKACLDQHTSPAWSTPLPKCLYFMPRMQLSLTAYRHSSPCA